MPIKHVELTTIEGKRFSKRGEKFINIRVDHHSEVVHVSDLNEREFSIEFRHSIKYSGIGNIEIEGNIIYEGDTEVVDEWRKTHKMPEEIQGQVNSAIMDNSVIAAISIARDLHLPPPIPLNPAYYQQQQQPYQKKEGFKGPEVA